MALKNPQQLSCGLVSIIGNPLSRDVLVKDLTVSTSSPVLNLYPSEDLFHIVENIGVEPMTSCVQGKRSSQLS